MCGEASPARRVPGVGHRSLTVGRGGIIVGVALLAFSVSDAFADATHYQTLQLGERSRGMAAAYTGFAADAAAI